MSLLYSTLPWCHRAEVEDHDKDAEDLMVPAVMSGGGDKDSSQLRDIGIQDPDDEKFTVEYVVDKRIGKKGWWTGKVNTSSF